MSPCSMPTSRLDHFTALDTVIAPSRSRNPVVASIASTVSLACGRVVSMRNMSSQLACKLHCQGGSHDPAGASHAVPLYRRRFSRSGTRGHQGGDRHAGVDGRPDSGLGGRPGRSGRPALARSRIVEYTRENRLLRLAPAAPRGRPGATAQETNIPMVCSSSDQFDRR